QVAIHTIKRSCESKTTRSWYKMKNPGILGMIVKILETTNIDMRLYKVKAHVGNILNDLANKVAKEGAKEKEIISVNVKETQGIVLRPTWNNISIKTPIRSFLKTLIQTFHKAEWKSVEKREKREDKDLYQMTICRKCKEKEELFEHFTACEVDEARWLEKEYSIVNQIWSNLDTVIRKRMTIGDLYTSLTGGKEADKYRKRNYMASGLIESDLATSFLAMGITKKVADLIITKWWDK
ncbi:15636_t:CDS:2, partial [Gigaspora margarita]